MLLAACGGPGSPQPEVAPIVVSPSEAEATAEQAANVAALRAADKRATAPDDYIEAEVAGIVAHPAGHAVLLLDPSHQTALPIFIGGTEALSIELRHSGQRYPRPLTHDLLDQVVARLGGTLRKVQIDAIVNQTFIGSIYIQSGDEVIRLDARPSDAIALAMGTHVPIFVHRAVFAEAGIRRDEAPPPDQVDVPPMGI
jgi:bifunctional DNase/RNase